MGLSSFDLAEYEKEGFCTLSNVFTSEEVERMQAAFGVLEERAYALGGATESDGAVFFVEGARIDRVCWCGAVAPYLLEIGRDPRLLEPIQEILATSECDHLINQAHFKLPGDGVDFPWHQDSQHRRYGTDLWDDVDGRGSFVQIFIAVDPATIENGCLYVFPRTHRHGHLSIDTKELAEVGINEQDALPVLLDPGDIVLFGPYLVHGSSENRSQSPRRALINGYSSPGANRRVYPGAGAGAGERIPLPTNRG